MSPRRCVTSVRLVAPLPVALLGLLAACTGDGESTESDPTPPVVTPTNEVARINDGTLRIGVLAPGSGEGAAIGRSLIDAATRAVDEINAAGGSPRGQQVELFVEDEGTSSASATEAIDALLDADVDAVVGPTSSTLALGTLDDLLGGGALACSPTATSLALDEYPGSDLFFRTVPSDTLQAAAIATLAEQTGARTAAVAYLDDTYGRPLAEATIASLEFRQLAVQARIPFAVDDESIIAAATQLVGDAVGVIVVIGDGDSGTRLLAALGDTAGQFPDQQIPDVIVNDAMRRPSSPQLLKALPAALREQVQGVAPLARAQQPAEPIGPFATNAYDCVNLIALAAVQSGTDDPVEMGARMVEVSAIGVACAEFASCVELLDDNRNIDYEGPGGVVQIGPNGDAQRARFEVFEFDENGIDRPLRPLPINA
ncbi:MAG: ABC transporter substrate-binding protein [Ilumatobacteraceae bacterium]